MVIRLIPIFVFLNVFFSLCYPAAGSEVSLDQKLQVNFGKYEEAKKFLLENHRNEVITERVALEAVLYPGPQFAINDKDIPALREKHRSIIERNRRRNEENSRFKLDSLKGDRILLKQFLFEMPKGGMLHNHPGGVRNLKTVREILERVNPVINIQEDIFDRTNKEFSYLYEDEKRILQQFPPISHYSDYNDYQKNYYINLFALPQLGKPQPFPRFTAVYHVGKILKKTRNSELRKWVEMKTYEDFIKRAASHNVSYVEFTRGFDYIRDVTQFEWWAKRWQKNYNVTARWNRAFLRVKDNARIAHGFDIFASGYIKKPSEVVQGIDLIANETTFPALEHGQTLYLKALELDQQDTIVMHRTMHAGELGHPKNPRDAILLGVERLGHGVKLYDDVLTLEYVRTQSGTPIVINLSSNIQIGVAPSIEAHPFLSFLRLGIPVSFSTDDEGMFVTDINNDILLAVLHTDISYAELKQMTYNSIENSFADSELKERLKIELDLRYAIFENKWEETLSEEDAEQAVSGN